MRDVDQDAGVDNQESNNQGSTITLGVDPAVGEDNTTLMIFKMDKKDKILLHSIMVANDQCSFKEVILDLIRKESRRLETLKIARQALGEQNGIV